MYKLASVILAILFIAVVVNPGKAEEDSPQYLLYLKTIGANVAEQQVLLEQIISMVPATAWTGWAKLEKAKILINEAEKGGEQSLLDIFYEVENLILSVIYDYGDLTNPASGIFRFPRGAYFIEEETVVKNLSEKIPVKLGHSARLELAKLYTDTGKNNDAMTQLDILINGDVLETLRAEFTNTGAPEDLWYPQQIALRMKFDLLVKEGQYYDAEKLIEKIREFGNPQDFGYAQAKIDEIKPYEIGLNIDPNTLNLRNKGKYITAYLLLKGVIKPADININTIKIAKIKYATGNEINVNILPAAGFSPEYKDFDSDGYAEMKVKFERAPLIVAMAGQEGIVELQIEGRTVAGKRFVGKDTIRVIGKFE